MQVAAFSPDKRQSAQRLPLAVFLPRAFLLPPLPPQPPLPPRRTGFRPTPDQWTFGKIVSHIAQSDFNLCAILSATPAPQNWKVTDADPKEKLVPAVKASLDFCSQALASLQDSKLGDTVKFFGGRQVPRARALIELTDDLEDHYSQLASYLRMNGMVPLSVRPGK